MIKRGELYYADLSPVVGSEQGGVRPILIVQNDVGNRYSPTVIAAAITSKINNTNKIAEPIEPAFTYVPLAVSGAFTIDTKSTQVCFKRFVPF